MNEILSTEEKDRETHRSIIIPLLGFSFTALLALSFANANLEINLETPIALLFISFLSYLVALNIQSYKDHRWHDVFSDLLMEIASLSLILSVIYIITEKQESNLLVFISLAAVAAWLVDHFARYVRLWTYLYEKEKHDVKK